MPDEGATTGTTHDARLHARTSSAGQTWTGRAGLAFGLVDRRLAWRGGRVWWSCDVGSERGGRVVLVRLLARGCWRRGRRRLAGRRGGCWRLGGVGRGRGERVAGLSAG